MDKIPFWEETYRNNEINIFPAEPNGTILEFEHLLRKDSAILEAGCGEGQNVRYLAKNGYSDIDAFDLSEAGISKLNRLCEKEGLRINAFVNDLTQYRFIKSYDLKYCLVAVVYNLPTKFLISHKKSVLI